MSENYLASKPMSRKAINAPDYELPDNNKFLFFDFYMTQALRMAGQTSHNPRLTEDLEIMEYSLDKEIKPKLYDALHSMVLEYLFGSIASESRYWGSANNVTVPKEMRDEKYKEYENAVASLRGGDTGRGLEERKAAAEKVFSSHREFVQYALPFFRDLSWAGGYGGKAWAAVCEAWLGLDAVPRGAGKFEAQEHALDVAFDACHNNGSALNKFPEWKGWLLPAMDYRRYSLEPWDLLHLTSSSMQRFAAKYLNVHGYGTQEDYLKNIPYARGGGNPESPEEWSEFEKQREEKNKILFDRSEGKNPTNDPNYNPRMRGDKEELKKILNKDKIYAGREIDATKEKVPGLEGITYADMLQMSKNHEKKVVKLTGKALKEGENYRGLETDKVSGKEIVRIMEKSTNDGANWANGVWVDGTWNNGTWTTGIWVSGTWNDGVWGHGYWESGTWNGGEWNGGWVLDNSHSGALVKEVEAENAKLDAENSKDPKAELKKGSWWNLGGHDHIWLPKGFDPQSYFNGKADEKYLEAAK